MSIVFENLHFAYFEDRRDIINGWSAEFSENRITVLTGPSGCGKSTLMYLGAGLYPHTTGVLRSGTVRVDGSDPESLAPQQRSRLVGMMFQDPELQFCMDSVENELIFCLENIGTEVSEIQSRLDSALEFCGITALKNRTLQSLSGGEKQRVALACLVALGPKWLLLDEPFANIDDDSAREIARKLKELHEKRGVGILAVDHRLDNWMDVADEIAIFDSATDSPEKMPISQLNRQLLEEKGIIVPGGSYAPDIAPAPAGEPVLVLQALSVCHGKKKILDSVDMTFRRGHIYAVVGQSGVGKSSLFGALAGVYPYIGHAFLDGKEVKRLRRKDLGRMGFVTQDPQDQFVGGSVYDEILVGLRRQSDGQKKTEEILRSIKLWRFREISPYLLSQGQQRRLGVAALMAYDCEVLVCDEPTYAQDRRNAMTIMESLCRQARERRVALIFSTHDRQLARDYADEILELKEGKLYAALGSDC